MDKDRLITDGSDERASAVIAQVALEGLACSAPSFGRSYSDLIAFVDEVPEFRVPAQQARNRLSALSQYLAHHQLDEGSQVGQELAGELDSALVSFMEAKTREGLSAGTLANIRTFVRQWARMWASYVSVKSAPSFDAISSAISYYVAKGRSEGRNLSLSAAAQNLGLNKHTFYRFAKKGTGNTRMKRKTLEALEKYLGAPPTSLTRFIACEPAGIHAKAHKTKQTGFGQKLASLLSKHYCLKKFPPRLLKEIQDFIRFKTAISPSLERNKKWRTKPKSQYTGLNWEWEIISLDGKTFSATAAIFLADVGRFFGSKAAHGSDPESFSLVHLCEPRQLDDYLEFCVERWGALSSGGTKLLALALQLLDPKGGWIYQQPAFGALLPNPVSTEEVTWREWCNASRAAIKKRLLRLEKDRLIKTGRDVQEPIKDILDRQHPLTALFEISDGIKSHIIKYASNSTVLNDYRRDAMHRDKLLFDILSVQPLRAKMFRDMTYKTDNTGHLYKRKTGEWAIRFAPEEFKNETGAASDKDYDVPLPPDLYEDLEHYLNKVRRSPTFARDQSDHVFVACQGKPSSDRRRGHWFGVMVRSRSRQFLPECPGFGPHAIRHIVATDYIKNNPGSYMVAADILHDRLETVMKAYAHLKAADGHRVFQEYRKGVAAAWKKTA